MKKNRRILLGLWIASVAGISFFGGTITYGFFWSVTLIPVICAIYLLCVYLRFRIYQNIEGKTLVCDQPFPFYFTLQNEDYFPFAGIKVQFFWDFASIYGIDPDESYELLPHTGIQKQTTLICFYRGEYEVGVRAVKIWDFLRLFSVTFQNPETKKVKVRPKIVHLSEMGYEDLNAFEQIKKDLADETDGFVREYAPYDDIRRIHWGVTARMQKPMVRTMIGNENERISILMSTMRQSDDPHSYIPLENKILEVTLAISLLFIEHQTPVDVYYEEDMLCCHNIEKMETFEILYDALSDVWFMKERKEEKLIYAALESEGLFLSKSVIFVVLTWDQTAYEAAQRLNEQLIPVIVYHIVSKKSDEGYAHPPLTTLIDIVYDQKLEEVL